MEEISMRGVDFEEAKAGVEGPPSGFAKGVYDCTNALHCDRGGHGVVGGKSNRAGCDNVAPAAFVFADFTDAIPRTHCAGFASGMGELDARYAALGVDEFGNAGEGLDVRIAPNPGILRADASFRQDCRSLDNNQCRSADGPAAEMHKLPILSQASVAGVLAHG